MWFRVILLAYGLALFVLSLFSLNRYALIALFRDHRRSPRACPPPLDARPADALPIVTIQLPLYNEYYVAERLIASACAVDYPRARLQVQVLDDSTDDTLALTRRLVAAWQAEGVWIEHVHRAPRQGYKAGALAEGLAHAAGEFIAVFDADFVVPPDFLRRTLPHFDAPDVGIVQGRWSYLNESYSTLTRATALGLDAQFVIEQAARDWGGLFLTFNGTAGVLRVACVRDAGGWTADTLTEDLDLSYRAQLRGWRIRYVGDVTCPSELPPDMHGLKTQQFRWTKGTQETARKLLPRLWAADLGWWRKLQGTLHLTANAVYPFLLLVGVLNPLAMLAAHTAGLHIPWLLSAYFVFSLTGTGFYYLAAERALHATWRGWLPRMLVFPYFLAACIGLSVSNAWGVFEAFAGRPSGFERTPKYRITQRSDRWLGTRYRSRATLSMLAELVLAVYGLGAAGYAVYVGEYAAVPFLCLFGGGYALVGVRCLYESIATALLRAAAARLPVSLGPRAAGPQ